MVLICNNNILTIEQFHKNRCIEKNAMSLILFDIKYNKEKFKENPSKEKEKENNGIYLYRSTNTPFIKPINSKYKI
jgi:hypothetical protein